METVGSVADASSAPALRVDGRIKWFDSIKGYGFIKPSNGAEGDVLLHQSCVRQSGFRLAQEGARVVCEVTQGPKGLQALRVLALDNTSDPMPMEPSRTAPPLTGGPSF